MPESQGPSDFATASSKEFLDIQATIECGFTLKRVRDMTRTYSMSFLIKNSEVWEKYEDIWDVTKNKLNIKFHGEPIYENKYLKAKVREFNGNIKTNFLGSNVPKENTYYTCIACITLDYVVKMDKKKLSTCLFRRV